MRNTIVFTCLFVFGCGSSPPPPQPTSAKAVTPSEYKAALLAFVEDVRSTAQAMSKTNDRDVIRGEKARLGKTLDALPLPPEGLKDGDLISQLKHDITVTGHEAIDRYFDAVTKAKLGRPSKDSVSSGDSSVDGLEESIESLKKLLDQIE